MKPVLKLLRRVRGTDARTLNKSTEVLRRAALGLKNNPTVRCTESLFFIHEILAAFAGSQRRGSNTADNDPNTVWTRDKDAITAKPREYKSLFDQTYKVLPEPNLNFSAAK